MNNKISFRRRPKISLQETAENLCKKDRFSLARAITLVESKNKEDQKMASELLDLILSETGKSFRIGISGVPGVGKSTFIEAFGKVLTNKGLKVAVLSIDPSSSRTKGSILGDKTRMAELSNDQNAFIRPSAAGATLGGVASATRDTILLCEAAGFDVIIVETVGVGQSETMVKEMVDYFLLLMLAGSGDELQGIKRGIMEMADHLLINKAEGDNLPKAKRAREDFKNAIHLFPPHEANWNIPVGLCSALEKSGIEEAWEIMLHYQKVVKSNGWFEHNRAHQLTQWFHEKINHDLIQNFYEKDGVKERIKKLETKITAKEISVRNAVHEVFSGWL